MKYHVTLRSRTHIIDVEGGAVTVDGERLEAHWAQIPGTPLIQLLLGKESWTVACQQLDDAGRVARLLESLAAVPPEKRTARFRCVIAVVEPDGREQFAEGVVEGVIAAAPRGTGGFGYDPVFYYPPLGRTLAEVTPAEKMAVDHRGRAVRAARRFLSG